METRWILITMLDGVYHREVLDTQEGAIKVRERKLAPRRVRNMKSPTGYVTIWPLGWTAIRKAEDEYGQR